MKAAFYILLVWYISTTLGASYRGLFVDERVTVNYVWGEE